MSSSLLSDGSGCWPHLLEESLLQCTKWHTSVCWASQFAKWWSFHLLSWHSIYCFFIFHGNFIKTTTLTMNIEEGKAPRPCAFKQFNDSLAVWFQASSSASLSLIFLIGETGPIIPTVPARCDDDVRSGSSRSRVGPAAHQVFKHLAPGGPYTSMSCCGYSVPAGIILQGTNGNTATDKSGLPDKRRRFRSLFLFPPSLISSSSERKDSGQWSAWGRRGAEISNYWLGQFWVFASSNAFLM